MAPNIDTFLRTWVPIMYITAARGTIFNWAGILSSSLKTNIQVAKNSGKYQPSKFYMEA